MRLKLLHTADWHLGRELFNNNRDDEHKAFLNWLLDTINKEEINCLIVSGDIFDNINPKNSTKEIYYNFLAQLKSTNCNNVIVVSGNHDSPLLLDTTKSTYAALGFSTTGTPDPNIINQINVVRIGAKAQAVVCMVPFLRPTDLHLADSTSSLEDRDTNAIVQIEKYYRKIVNMAVTKQQEIKLDEGVLVPIIATGHLDVKNTNRLEFDGVKDIYKYASRSLTEKSFPEEIDYLALGHIHLHQHLSNKPQWNYCGSPLMMNFSEVNYKQIVNIVTFDNVEGKFNSMIEQRTIPQYRVLKQFKGSIESIKAEITEYLKQNEGVRSWFKVSIDDAHHEGDLSLDFDPLLTNSNCKIIKYEKAKLKVTNSVFHHDGISDIDQFNEKLTPEFVFAKRLEGQKDLSEEDKKQLTEDFMKILDQLAQGSKNENT